VAGTVFSNAGVTYLIVSSSLKNVGGSQVFIQSDVSGLRLSYCGILTDVEEAESADDSERWEELGFYSVFEKHRWIESGETVEEQQLLSVPGENYTAFQLTMRIVSPRRFLKQSIFWEQSKIARWEAEVKKEG
jgi:hypothetical protein